MSENANHLSFVNGDPHATLPLKDRGLNYGDGLFETMRYIDGGIPLLEFHAERLDQGLSKLKFPKKARTLEAFKDNVDLALRSCFESCIVKIIVTRGHGSRGYMPNENIEPNIVVSTFPLPTYPDTYYLSGIEAKICEYRIPKNPSISQIKHLNRLDQVLASLELEREHEGIVLDMDGHVIEGTKSNIILVENGVLITPDTSQCGVDGVLLRYMRSHPDLFGSIGMEVVSIDRLMNADGVFFVNSVYGVLPASKIGDRDFVVQPVNSEIRQILKNNLKY